MLLIHVDIAADAFSPCLISPLRHAVISFSYFILLASSSRRRGSSIQVIARSCRYIAFCRFTPLISPVRRFLRFSLIRRYVIAMPSIDAAADAATPRRAAAPEYYAIRPVMRDADITAIH